MSSTSYDGFRQRLEAIDPRAVQPGLGRIRSLLDALDAPHLAYPTAIIAGTNGKGSVAAMLSAIGRAAGQRVGFYTSPHLASVAERLQIGDSAITDAVLEAQLGEVFAVADELFEDGLIDQQPSHFEILTAVAFRWFAEANVDLAILEVGLGGRWDATNVTRPRVAVLTPIALDHEELLGDELRSIAAEKAAVIPEQGLAVVAAQEPDVMEVIRHHVQVAKATLWAADDYALVLRRADERLRYSFDCVGRLRDYVGMEMSLPGEHQVHNARCAILAAEALDRRRLRISSDAIWAGLRSTSWPGRCEWVDEAPAVLLDAAHNPAAAGALAEYLWELRRRKSFDRLRLVFGAMDDKDVAGMARHLFPLADSLVATRPPGSRAVPAARIAAEAGAPASSRVHEDPERALEVAREESRPEDLICVTGSAYLVGAIRPLLVPG